MACLAEDEATKVMRYMQAADKKRALISRLLQRRACFEALDVDYASVKIERTKGGKPFVSNKPAKTNWNFNVSHEGRYVVLASEPTALCGVDVAAPTVVRDKKPKPMAEQLRVMRNQLTAAETAMIMGASPDEVAMENHFRRFWSLKEAYTKARGDGIAFDFGRCDFELGVATAGTVGQPVRVAHVKVDGKALAGWCFYIQELEGNHWISVARGPCADVVDAHGKFKATLSPAASTGEAHQAALHRPEPPFASKGVADLVPDRLRAEYERIISKGEA